MVYYISSSSTGQTCLKLLTSGKIWSAHSGTAKNTSFCYKSYTDLKSKLTETYSNTLHIFV